MMRNGTRSAGQRTDCRWHWPRDDGRQGCLVPKLEAHLPRPDLGCHSACTCTSRQHRTFSALASSSPRADAAGAARLVLLMDPSDDDDSAFTLLCRSEGEVRARARSMHFGCISCKGGSVKLLAIDQSRS